MSTAAGPAVLTARPAGHSTNMAVPCCPGHADSRTSYTLVRPRANISTRS